MKTKLSRTAVENRTCWNLLGICYWCRFFIRGIFVATKQYANSIQPNCKNRAHPTPSCSLVLEIPFSSSHGVFVKRDGVNMHKSLCDCCHPELFSPQATWWVGHTELFLGGQRALGWSFWMILWGALRGNLWWVLPVTSVWWADCHGLKHTGLLCPSLSPSICSNSCPLCQWCHPNISSSVMPFSSCLQSFPASGSFQMSQFFASGGHEIQQWV